MVKPYYELTCEMDIMRFYHGITCDENGHISPGQESKFIPIPGDFVAMQGRVLLVAPYYTGKSIFHNAPAITPADISIHHPDAQIVWRDGKIFIEPQRS